MKKVLLTTLLCVFVCGCSPVLTRGERLEEVFAVHPEWSLMVKQKIVFGTICLGMTPEQVQLAWDRGTLRQTYRDSDGREGYEIRFTTVHYHFSFQDGKLVDWQEYRFPPEHYY